MTTKNMRGNITRFSAAALAACILAGCGGGSSHRAAQPLPGQPSNTPPPEIARPDLIQPALNTIGERIRSYEKRLEEIRAIENSPASMMVSPEKMGRLAGCKTSLLDILTNYDSLQKRLQRETNLDRAQNLANNMLQQVNRQDMRYLEGDCSRLIADLRQSQTMQTGPGGQSPAPPSGAWEPAASPDGPGHAQPAFAAPDPRIRQAFAAGDYSGVISLYNRNWAQPGQGSQAAPDTTWLYCRALLKNYQTDEARRALSALDARLESPGGSPLSADVLRVLGDIALGEGNYQDAQEYYSREMRLPGSGVDSWSQRQLAALRDQDSSGYELSDYAALIRAWLAYVPERDGLAVAEQAERFLQTYPASRLVANVNEIHRQTREQARQNAGDISTPQVPEQAPPHRNETPQAGGEPDFVAAPLSAEQVAAREQALREQYERGRNQMASGNYDAAIQTFSTLRGSSLDAEARESLNDAAVRAGESNRQRAAELFVRANQTADIQTRRRLLAQSRDLLREIPQKYPQAGLDDKVARNLASVEEALQGLEPPPPQFPEGAPQQPVRRSL